MCGIDIPARDPPFFSSAANRRRLADQGRLEEAKSADFVLCGGDALADVKRAAPKRNHGPVVKRGINACDNRAVFVGQPARVAAE